MIVLENPLLEDTVVEEEGSGDESVDDMEISGALKSGKVSEEGMKTMTHINNVPKLKERLEAIQKKLPWIENLDVTVDLKVPIEDMKAVINDNFKQEMLFYKQSQVGAQQSIARLISMGISTERPEDYFAEMVKSDVHMKRVKEKLISKQLTMERTEKVSKMRKMKRLGKKVQQEVLKKRADDKKGMIEKVKKIRKGKAEQADADDFEINTEPETSSGKKGKDDINKKRKAKDSKYGFGGKKKMAKKNTQESAKDVTTFSSRIHSKPKRSAKNDKRMGGGKPSGKPSGKPQRPGKTKRANNKNRARNK